MAPLSTAVQSRFMHETKGADGAPVYVYDGIIDPEWSFMDNAVGGYVVAMTLEAVARHQQKARHPDPVHVTAHFLSNTVPGPYEIHVRLIKAGKGTFTTLSASFWQKGQERVRAHTVFGDLTTRENRKSTRPDMAIDPLSLYAAQSPVQTHPSKCPLIPEQPKWLYIEALDTGRMKVARDPIYDKSLWKPGPMEVCNYITIGDEDEAITPSMLPFFADIFLPFAAKNPKLPSWTFWTPTIVFSLEFKHPLPKPDSKYHSLRTVAAYHRGKFFNEPHGRQETYMEIWTAPANIGDSPDTELEGWRDQQRCLAIAHQLNIMVDIDSMPGGGRHKLKPMNWTRPKL
ncbi:hypothetical protein NM688_g8830 [Phlebia brevispora]|uniref:Uncharacterized protein n=1 Tax=Phlebia brevispora TaxID=194682 RepID=A0ACC1RPJ2_9APHY|nr:hypothetical protein NM688_g8830 [Phlebia brevispora]